MAFNKKDSKRPCSLTHLEQKLIVQSPSFNAANICEQSTVAVPEANMLAARVVTMSSSHMLCLFEGKLGVIWFTINPYNMYTSITYTNIIYTYNII